MNAFDLAKKEQSSIMEQAILNAYAVMAVLGRREDEISANEAYRLYDRGWIIDRTQRGLLHFSRKGATSKSAKVYSRFEIEALKRAEKHIAEAYDNAEYKAKTLDKFIQQNYNDNHGKN